MGCDGGTIPKRNEIVKNKQKDQGRDKNADLSAKWQFCALSGLRLKKPIVACQLGSIYNKVAIIEHLLDSKQSATTSNSIVSHIKTLKDIRELKLKEKPEFNKAHQASSGNEQFKAQFVCPISGLDMNGKYKFYYLLKCGCVLSERALKEVPNDKQCILCSKAYDPKMDLIVLNGDPSEVDDLKRLLSDRRRQNKNLKREHQHQPKVEDSKKLVEPSTSNPSSSSSSAAAAVFHHSHRRKCDDTDDVKRNEMKHSKRHKRDLIATR